MSMRWLVIAGAIFVAIVVVCVLWYYRPTIEWTRHASCCSLRFPSLLRLTGTDRPA